MHLLDKILKVYQNTEKIIVLVIFGVLFGVVMLQIISRYLFMNPIIWTDEISTLLQVVLTFLGIGYVFRKKGHISVDFIYRKLPITYQYIISSINGCIIIFCLVLLVKDAFTFLASQNIEVNTVPSINISTFYLSFPIGCLIAIVYLFFDILNHILILLGKKRILTNSNDLIRIDKHD